MSIIHINTQTLVEVELRNGVAQYSLRQSKVLLDKVIREIYVNPVNSDLSPVPTQDWFLNLRNGNNTEIVESMHKSFLDFTLENSLSLDQTVSLDNSSIVVPDALTITTGDKIQLVVLFDECESNEKTRL